MTKKIIYTILWSTIEDFVGLWEILWELNSIFPNKSEKYKREIIQKVLKYFLKEDLIVAYWSNWGDEELKEVNSDELFLYLGEVKYWNAPALNEQCIKIGNTSKGQKFYEEKLINSFTCQQILNDHQT